MRRAHGRLPAAGKASQERASRPASKDQMNAGNYTHRIAIQQNTPSVSASGAETPSWSTFAQRWAEIIPEDSTEFARARQMNSELSLMLRCPGFMAVTSSMRVVHSDGRVFDIAGIPRGKNGKSPALAEEITLDLIEGKRKES